ncbi:TonB-dependent receptor [Caulobacter sp. Root1455]|uniref:TonB-dependent receptor n=1 Tax=unclassified Caulobacter TaxID=2648921 RepID=UPI0006F1D0D9|nr:MULTISPECIES: TonB-dependent receptor [unclassified Caulobacter]KQY26146.1 TonB-dependent receptor [Caulobacter sp. Root487D2Y]KQZ04082.1 TonB-dependent receptor [Caulobacter sp. Root1455]
MRKVQVFAGVAGAAMLAAAGQASAQEATALDEIVVTAQKRSENLQDVPVSVTALTADQLKDQRVGDVLALSGLSPGLQIKTDDNAANPRIFIRGIGVNDFNPATASAVGVYVDGVYVASPLAQMAGFYDLQQVEVLRGPQGTLYGRNTTGGAINVTTKKPTSTPQGDLAVDYGRFSTLNVQAGFGGPVVGDTLAFRIAGLYDKSDGYTLNRLTGHKGNDAERKAARFALRYTPDDKLTVDLSASYSKSTGGSILTYNRSLVAQTAEAASTTDPDPTYGYIFCKPTHYTSGQCTNVAGYANTSTNKYEGDYRFEGKDIVKLFGATSAISYDFGGVTLYSVTGYQKAERDDWEETDANPISIFDARYIAEQDTASQEFRLQSNGATALRWVAGLYAARDNLDNNSHYNVLEVLRVPDPVNNPTGMDPANGVGVFGWPLHQKTTSYAAFGQVDYDLTAKLTLTGGLRWSQDKKTFHYVSDVDYGLLTLFEYDNAKTFSSISGRLGLRYALSDDANVYATYNRGTKSGGFFSGQTTDPRDLGPYKDETVNAYEVGAKSEFLGRRLRVNVSAFYYDYKDLQVYTQVQRDGLPVQLFTNASAARVYGGEAEIEARPVTGLSLTLGASLLSAEYKDFISYADPSMPPLDYSGNTLPSAPKASLNGAARYEHPLGGGDLITQLDFTYRGKVYYDTANTERLSDKARAYVNGQVGWAFADGRYELGVWGKNLADTTNISDITPIAAFGFDVFSMGPPRTYGVYFRAKY